LGYGGSIFKKKHALPFGNKAFIKGRQLMASLPEIENG